MVLTARHYTAAYARSEVERGRVERIAAAKFRRLRGLSNARARREQRQAFPPPSTATVDALLRGR